MIVFELLGKSLLDLIEAYNCRGLPIAVVKKIAKEVLIGLDYLHNECNIIHTDLKPENIMMTRCQFQRITAAVSSSTQTHSIPNTNTRTT